MAGSAVLACATCNASAGGAEVADAGTLIGVAVSPGPGAVAGITRSSILFFFLLFSPGDSGCSLVHEVPPRPAPPPLPGVTAPVAAPLLDLDPSTLPPLAPEPSSVTLSPFARPRTRCGTPWVGARPPRPSPPLRLSPTGGRLAMRVLASSGTRPPSGILDHGRFFGAPGEADAADPLPCREGFACGEATPPGCRLIFCPSCDKAPPTVATLPVPETPPPPPTAALVVTTDVATGASVLTGPAVAPIRELPPAALLAFAAAAAARGETRVAVIAAATAAFGADGFAAARPPPPLRGPLLPSATSKPFALQLSQYHLPFGTSANGGFRQYVWYSSSQCWNR